VFDGLIAIHARSGNLDEAFGYAETARAVELAATAQTGVAATRNMLAGDGAQRLALTRASLGPGQMLLHSAVLLDRLHLWYVTRDSTMVRTVEIAEADLTDAINRFGVLLESRALAAADTIGTRLYETLLGPVLDDAAVDELIIVPDKALQRVAFAALRDPASGRYLIELMALVVAPSAAFALNASGPVRTARYERAVLVADPEFDRERFPDLPRLRNARQEVQALEDLYDGEITLDGVEATIAAFRAVASEADLIHFAGHGRYRPDRPDLSYLVFAKGGAEGGALLARDIRRLDLSQRPLVVLSACETALPELSRTGGFGALARSFLVAGAPAVVGSLWVVEDERTARFMASFHAQLANGQPPAAALRQAQIAAIREDDDRVGVWAAFRYEGVARQR
jgi:CHAT domain-containing protein